MNISEFFRICIRPIIIYKMSVRNSIGVCYTDNPIYEGLKVIGQLYNKRIIDRSTATKLTSYLNTYYENNQSIWTKNKLEN
jgi:hypothetical protein